MSSLKTRLTKLAALVAEQASRDSEFAAKIEEILGIESTKRIRQAVRKGGRRAAALFDPIAKASEGKDGLYAALSACELEQLLDIVAEYGMDPGKLVMKWKDKDRIIDRIVDVSITRATKGDAFRAE